MKQFVLGLLTALTVTSLSLAQQSYSDLEELASRVIGFGYDLPDLIVGKAPNATQLGFEFTALEGTKIIGTVQGQGRFEVVLDVRADADAILAFYKNKLVDFKDSGSSRSEPTGGLSFSSSATQRSNPEVKDTLFCKENKSVNIVVYRATSAIKDVRIIVDPYTCEFSRGSAVANLPLLLLPSGTSMRGGLRSQSISSVKFSSSQSIEATFEHYGNQLSNAKWVSVERSNLKQVIVGIFENATQKIMLSVVMDSNQLQTVTLQVL
jgi:hypothetical protein